MAWSGPAENMEPPPSKGRRHQPSRSTEARRVERKLYLARLKERDPQKFAETLRRRGRRREGKRSPEYLARKHARRMASPKRREYERVWRRGHAHERNERRRRRWVEDLQFRLSDILRSRLYSALKGRRKTGSAVRLLGCSVEGAVQHLERQFRPGMAWENHGPVWHVDHIRPLASFDLTDPEQLAHACHYTNLQPLFAAENIAKRDRLDWARAGFSGGST